MTRKSGEAALMSESKWSLRELNDGAPAAGEQTSRPSSRPTGPWWARPAANPRYRSVYRVAGESPPTMGLAGNHARMSGAPSVMQQEAEFLSAVRAVRSFRLVAGDWR